MLSARSFSVCSSRRWFMRGFMIPPRYFHMSALRRHVTRRLSLALTCLMLLALEVPKLSSAQDVKSTIEHLDPSVTFVVTGGQWHRGDDAGEVRIIIASAGFEHVTSALYVQWVLVDPDSHKMHVIQTEGVKEFAHGSWALTAPRINWHGENWNVTVDGADSRSESPRSARWRLDIGPPGEVRVSRIPRSS